MKFSAMAARLSCGLALVALLGCHTYSPYGPYRYGYPPGGNYGPNNFVNPPGTVSPGTPTPNGLGQPGTIPDGTNNNGPTAPTPKGASKGQPFEANRNGGLFPNEKPVPDPNVDSTSFPGSSAKNPPNPAPMGTSPATEAGKSDLVPPPMDTGKGDAGTPKSPFDESAGKSGLPSNPIQPIGGEVQAPSPTEPKNFQPPKDAAPIPSDPPV